MAVQVAQLDPAPFFWRAGGRAGDVEIHKKRGDAHLYLIQLQLIRLGWPIPDTNSNLEYLLDAVQCFQEGFGLDNARLTVDRDPWTQTTQALQASVDSGGYAWSNFRWVEFRDKGDGWIRVRWETGATAQAYRTAHGAPVFVISAQRSLIYNREVGSTSFPHPGLVDDPDNEFMKPGSRHPYAEALDLQTTMKLGKAMDLGLASGFGIAKYSAVRQKNKRLMHFDNGGLCYHGSNKYARQGGTLDPQIWEYPTR